MVIVMIILYLLFLKFSAKEAIVLFAIPVLMHFHLEYLIPVAAGVALSPYLIIPAVSSFFYGQICRICHGCCRDFGTGCIAGTVEYRSEFHADCGDLCHGFPSDR
jgi:hypothetical protein